MVMPLGSTSLAMTARRGTRASGSQVSGFQSPERVRALCDRRAGIGADGVLRAVRRDDGWFMDYRNADGSVSEMCGNGIRVFARHLVEEGLADPARPIPIDTRDGVKLLTVDGDQITADMGTPQVLGETKVGVPGHTWAARHVDMGNPHAVAFVSTLEEPGSLLERDQFLNARRNRPRAIGVLYPEPVSYTHLTLPTNREV